MEVQTYLRVSFCLSYFFFLIASSCSRLNTRCLVLVSSALAAASSRCKVLFAWYTAM